MPKVDYNLASKRMSTGGNPGGISPVLINSGAGLSLRAPGVNTNAGNVKWADMAAPSIRPDQTISQMAAAGGQMIYAALAYQERVDDAEAKQRVLTFENQLTSLMSGDEGYLYTTGQEAVKTYADMAGRIRQAIDGSFEGAGEAVQARMAAAVHHLANEYTSKGALHKARQQQVWETNIQENQLAVERTKMLQTSNSPEEFNAQLTDTLAELDNFFDGKPEQAKKAKRLIVEDAYLAAAVQQTKLNNFALAVEYVMQGVDAGVDPLKTATALEQVETALYTHNNRLDIQARQNAADYKVSAEKANHNILRVAMDTSNRDALKSIADPLVQIKYEKLYDDFITGRPSHRAADSILQDFVDQATKNPEDILFHPFAVYISPVDRKKAYTQVLSDRKLNITQQRKEAQDYVKTLIQLPVGMTKPSGMEAEMRAPTDGPHPYYVMEREVNNQRAYWNSRFNRALEESKTDAAEDATSAVYRVKAEMLDEMNKRGLHGQNVSSIRVPPEVIQPIANLPFATGGMIEYTQLVGTSEALGRSDIAVAYQDATLDILSKYGIPDETALANMLLKRPGDYEELLFDMQQLNLQQQYLIQGSYGAGAPNAK